MDVFYQSPTIRLIISRLPWIVGISLLFSFGVALFLMLQPPVYTASVQVLLRGSAAALSNERRQTLVHLATSPDVEEAVREELKEALPPGLRAPGALRPHLSAVATAGGEIISLTVKAPAPDLAEEIAGVWSSSYSVRVGQLFPMSTQASPQLEQALSAYQSAERAYVSAESAVSLNKGRLNALQELLDSLSRTRDRLRVAREIEVQLDNSRNAGTSPPDLSDALRLLKSEVSSIAEGGIRDQKSPVPANNIIVVAPDQTGRPSLAEQQADLIALIGILERRIERLTADAAYIGSRPGEAQPNVAPYSSGDHVDRDTSSFEQQMVLIRRELDEQTVEQRRLNVLKETALQRYNTVRQAADATNLELTVSGRPSAASEVPRRWMQLIPRAAVVGALLVCGWVLLVDRRRLQNVS